MLCFRRAFISAQSALPLPPPPRNSKGREKPTPLPSTRMQVGREKEGLNWRIGWAYRSLSFPWPSFISPTRCKQNFANCTESRLDPPPPRVSSQHRFSSRPAGLPPGGGILKKIPGWTDILETWWVAGGSIPILSPHWSALPLLSCFPSCDCFRGEDTGPAKHRGGWGVPRPNGNPGNPMWWGRLPRHCARNFLWPEGQFSP